VIPAGRRYVWEEIEGQIQGRALEDPRLGCLLLEEGKRRVSGPEKAVRQEPKMQKGR
jgi:hypothetical protein